MTHIAEGRGSALLGATCKMSISGDAPLDAAGEAVVADLLLQGGKSLLQAGVEAQPLRHFGLPGETGIQN